MRPSDWLNVLWTDLLARFVDRLTVNGFPRPWPCLSYNKDREVKVSLMLLPSTTGTSRSDGSVPGDFL